MTKKIIICGCAKNIVDFWTNTSKNLQIIFDSLEDYKCIIIESNSTDNSLETLNDWSKNNPKINIVSLGNLEEHSRTKRIALCRNKYLEIIEPFYEDFPYCLFLDLDNALEIYNNFKEQLQSCFQKDNWDAIASNRRGRYYDIWALRSKQLGIDFDCWLEIQRQPSIFLDSNNTLVQRNNVHYFVRRFQNIIPETSEWISCESAFGSMVLYKSSSIKGKRYDGSQTCEHVSFNQGLKMYINPAFLSGGECLEHL